MFGNAISSCLPCNIPPRLTRNLWTQELRANCLQMLIAHPEPHYGGGLGTIIVQVGLPLEDSVCAGAEKAVATAAVSIRNHCHERDVPPRVEFRNFRNEVRCCG